MMIGSIFLLSSCHHHNKSSEKNTVKIIVAKDSAPIQRLYFAGTLAPISTSAVVSPAAGNVVTLDFTYGEKIEAGQRLVVIDSKILADQYRKAVSDYLQKKQSYETNQFTFQGTQALYKAGVIAKTQYISGKTQYDNAVLDYSQSKYSLEKVLKTVNVDPTTIESLSLGDTKKVNDLLQQHFRHVSVIAPVAGVALYPLATQKSDDNNSSGKLTIGTDVKAGQLLLSIGDLSGLSASFNVSEIDINKIKKGMPVTVTGSAFPHNTLQGVVSAVSAEANQNTGTTGMSMFTVNIKIPTVSKQSMSLIRVGMTAKFEMDLHGTHHIMLPVSAVFQKNGQSEVTLLDVHNQQKNVRVETGDTTPARVVILHGVKAGDRVVMHD